MKQNIIIIILFLALLGFAFVGWRKNISENIYIDEIVNNFSIKKESLIESVLVHSRFAHPFIFPKTFELINEENKTVKLNDIIQGKTTLVYKISKHNCSSCIEAELNPLDTLYNKNPMQNKVILFAAYYGIRELKNIKKKYKIKYPVYGIKDPQFFGFLAAEKPNSPYFFVLDSTFSAKMIFFPDKILPELSKGYCSQVLNLFEERN